MKTYHFGDKLPFTLVGPNDWSATVSVAAFQRNASEDACAPVLSDCAAIPKIRALPFALGT